MFIFLQPSMVNISTDANRHYKLDNKHCLMLYVRNISPGHFYIDRLTQYRVMQRC